MSAEDSKDYVRMKNGDAWYLFDPEDESLWIHVAGQMKRQAALELMLIAGYDGLSYMNFDGRAWFSPDVVIQYVDGTEEELAAVRSRWDEVIAFAKSCCDSDAKSGTYQLGETGYEEE